MINNIIITILDPSDISMYEIEITECRKSKHVVENEVVAIDTEETNNQTTTSEIPAVPEEKIQTNVGKRRRSMKIIAKM